MRFPTDLHLRDLAGRIHWPHGSHAKGATPITHHHTSDEDAEVAKATLYVSTVTLVVLLVVLAAIAFGQEAMHWLGVH
ncbi:hypothetical protein D9M68_702210 [compost metagenome]|uniref:hypothetical protein n=1 Tax=Cupriavidus TaxID=106589 RepID=UPI00048CED24|nr:MULTISPECIES: hypothetical protein [unclassified Cupriavidus]MBP0623003.1 hypothetical protein [Cupriavidus sp. LEh25]MBP0631946.1 hypothetical protein [Cupriavidus sp. AcVe19-1a]MBP0635968.1 hypothetical protein [Cupriavidus sp. AcVe19-6a]MDK2659691.1 hypothetical protein [Cupriavidus sp. LEh21]